MSETSIKTNTYREMFCDVMQKYLLDERLLIEIIDRNVRRFFVKNQTQADNLIGLNFEKKHLYFLKDGEISIKKIKDRNDDFDRALIADFQKHKNRILRLNQRTLYKYIIEEFFDYRTIFSLKLSQIDEKNECLIFKKDSHKMFDFVCPFDGMFEQDSVEIGYNYVFKLTRVEIKKDRYIVYCKRKHKDVVEYEFLDFKKFFISAISLKNKEVANGFDLSLAIKGINPDGQIFLRLSDKKYRYLLNSFIRLFNSNERCRNFKIVR